MAPTPSDLASTGGPTVDVRRAGTRFHTRTDWLDSWHSFSFGPHHDPTNTGHGLLLVSNDDVVAPGRGFGAHPHRDMEIVTWVVSGALEHADTLGNRGVITPGLAQHMSAGRGIQHAEVNASPDEPVRLVQMWVPPDTAGIAPSYEQADVSGELAGGGLVAVAGPPGAGAAVSVRQAGAALWVARLAPGRSVEVPDAPHAHVFVAVGLAELAGAGPLGRGDAARLTGAGSPALAAGPEGAEVLIWATA